MITRFDIVAAGWTLLTPEQRVKAREIAEQQAEERQQRVQISPEQVMEPQEMKQ